MNMFVMEEPQIGSPDDRRDWLARIQQQSGIEMREDFIKNGGINFSGMWNDITGKTEENAANDQRDKQYKYDKKNWEYQWKNTKEVYKHEKDVVKTARENNVALTNLQNASAQADWQHQLAIDDYEFNQQMGAYNASVQQTKDQLDYNQKALDVSIEAEKRKLGEKTLQAAFDHQAIIHDLFVSTGTADFEKAALTLGLDKQISTAGYQESKQLNNLNLQLDDLTSAQSRAKTQFLGQKASSELTKDGIELKAAMDIGDYEFQKQNSRINFEDALNENVYETSEQNQKIKAKERENKLAYQGLGLDVLESEEEKKFAQKRANAELDKISAKYAYEQQDKAIQALQAQGKARLGQAGASTGAAVVGILASLGRQATAINDSLMRETDSTNLLAAQAESTAEMKRLEAEQKGKALDEALFSTVEKASNKLFKANSELGIAGQERDYQIGRLDQKITDVADMADQNIKQERTKIDNLNDLTRNEIEMLATKGENLKAGVDIENNQVANVLQHHRDEAKQKEEKIDWDVLRDKDKFKHNQDVIAAMLDKAAEETQNMIKGLTVDKGEADMLAQAGMLSEPVRGPAAPQPLEIPYTKYEDPMNPKEVGKPPKPIKGLKATGAGFIKGLTTIGEFVGNIGSAFSPGGGGGGGSGSGPGSDLRLKENIIQIGTSPSGLNIYEWNYIGDKVTERYRGVIAQDLISKGRQDAVTTNANGYLGVYYDKIDVNMERI